MAILLRKKENSLNLSSLTAPLPAKNKNNMSQLAGTVGEYQLVIVCIYYELTNQGLVDKVTSFSFPTEVLIGIGEVEMPHCS